MLSGTNGVEAIGQVISVTQDANFVHIATTFSGGFPTDVTTISTHPSPKFNCSGCTGDAQAVAMSGAPTDAPIFSYQTYTIPGSAGTTVQPVFIMWGALSQLEINVTSLSSAASTFHVSEFDNWPIYVSGTGTTYGPKVNAHIAGDRKVNSSGAITCNGSAGVCDAGDSLTTSAGTWFGGASNSGPQYNASPSAGTSTTLTIQTNQGVVNP
jgi:hypothetical protein